MKQVPIDVLYGKFEAVFQVPSTVEESDNLLGETGATLDGSNDNVVYRNTLPRFYGAIADALIASGHKKNITGQTKPKKADEKPKDILEGDIPFIDRVHTEGDDELKKQIGELVSQHSATTPFYVEGQRGGGGKVSQGALDAANRFFAEGDVKVEAVIEHIESTIPGYKVAKDASGAATPESLARAIQALGKHAEVQAKKATANALATLG